ncbi:protein DEHYDRATION-INDUCED 19 homolog 5-like [Lotus japonicus]|uniref:Drought induced 19 protein type zinc-binding domain-containing protein n=1 Tax=Lotus japonicus TaxID=34305 RepID=I3T675_LOTJA|nr:protein DEHYDRATION-INDUCED 19 homolog 5-like [Lotus japonicus]AFK36663.1 unknown [Lotus japonicus]AFK48017.1 unknown [Lotus japonicus]
MDFDFRASTIHSANHLSSLHAARLHSEKFSVFSYGDDDDDDAQSLFRCPSCDFEIEVSVLRTRLQEVHCFDPKNKVCPVCDEKIGEDAVGIPQHSNSRKRTMRFEKSSISSGDLGMIDHKLASWGNKHYPVSDPPLSPFFSKSSVPSPSSIISDEDSISTASDVSNVKSLGTETLDSDAGDEQDHEERSQRASFVQDLVFSTLV